MKKGFTIVEILIVVVVIGILAGITVVGYGAWRERTAITTVKNDLLAADVVMKGAQDRQTGFPTTLPSGYESSEGVTLILKPGSNATFYCFEATTTGKPNATFFLDSNKNTQPTEGTCTMPYSPPAIPPSVTNYSGGYGFAIHPLTDDAYASTSIGSGGQIRRVPLTGGAQQVIMSNPANGAIRSMVFDSTGKLYIAGGSQVYRVDLNSLTSVLIATVSTTARTLYLDGDNTLYIGSDNDIQKYTVATSTLTTVYSGSTANYQGIAKVGEYLYLMKFNYGLSRYNLTTNQMTVSYSAAPITGSAGNLIESNNKLYTILNANLYMFDIASSTWSVARSDIKTSTCSYPNTLGKKYVYLFYIGRLVSTDTSCATPTGGYGIQSFSF